MLEIKTFSDGALIEVHATGRVTGADYAERLVPAVEDALKSHDRVRMLVEFTALFEGFDLDAAWADLQLGLSHWTGFDRIAVVTDKEWIANSVRVMSVLMPCPVKVFRLDQADEARRWLRESLGSVHIKDLGQGVLHVQLLGKLDPEVIERAEQDLDARIRANDDFRLLLDLREFDGWQGLSALAAHFKLAREHAPLASKVAIVSDEDWLEPVQRMASRFINAKTQHFDDDDFEGAKAWLTN